MNGPSAAQRDLALLLLEHHRSADPGANLPAARAGRLTARLSRQLTPLIGTAGFDAIFARAVTVTCRDLGLPPVPASEAVTLAFVGALDPAVAEEAVTSIYTWFFHLLTSFIGEALTLQLVRRALPDLAIRPNEKA